MDKKEKMYMIVEYCKRGKKGSGGISFCGEKE
jgi:hypothetical protein